MQGKESVHAKKHTISAGARGQAVTRQGLARFAKGALHFGMGYLVGPARLLFNTNPLGVALLCACKRPIWLLGGLILAELMRMDNPILMISTYAAVALIRGVSSFLLEDPNARVGVADGWRARLRSLRREDSADKPPKPAAAWKQQFSVLGQALGDLFTESLCLRIAVAGIAMLAISLFRIVDGGFRYYDLFAALFAIPVAAAAVPVLSICAEGKTSNRILYVISAYALMLSLVWSANFVALGRIPVSAVLALLITLWATQREGLAFGVGAGIVCGLAYRPILLPAYLLAALIYGGARRWRGDRSGILLACLGALAWTLYADGALAFSTALPAYLLAGAVFSPILLLTASASPAPAAEPPSASPDPEAQLRLSRSRQEESSDSFRSISDAFSSLSEIFYNLSDRLRRPGALDLRRICDTSFDAYCNDCPNKTICWGLEYSETYAQVGTLISHLHTEGTVTAALIPDHLRRRCPSMELILSRINSECARFTGELLRSNRTEIFAMDYEAAANIINDALKENDGEYRFDPDLEARLMEYLTDAGISARSVSVYGMRRRQLLVQGVNVDRSTVTPETLRCDLGEMCGLELSSPVFEVENNISTMILQARRKLSVMGAQNNLSADGGVSGDSVNLFSNKKDYFYALISDGMGSGRDAAFTSNLCSTFLEKMLRAGNRAVTSLRMLNNLILSRCPDSSGECSSTVDLIELDLITGRANFIKGGAAPSFVVRNGTVRRLQAGTFPIGIIRTLDTQASSYELRPSDTVVMISDGILQDDPDYLWLTDYLSSCGDKEPDEIVYEICLHASQFPSHDDCSAIALRILPAEEFVV